MAVKQIIHPRGEKVREVFFPNGGVASITTVMQDGSMVEIATVGTEGVLGVFDGAMMSTETMMQVPDTNAEVMSVEIFEENSTGAARFTSASDAIRRAS